MTNSWTSQSWQEYFITPGGGKKLYVLRERGQHYWINDHTGEEGYTDFDHLVRTLGKNLDECKIKADKEVGKDNYVVEESELDIITQTKDERRHFKFPNGRTQGKDIDTIDLDDKSAVEYTTWWWSEYNYVDAHSKGKSYQKFHKNLEDLLIEKEILVDYKDVIMTIKSYDYKIKKEGWKAEAERQAKISKFVGEIKVRVESEIRMVFSMKVAETTYGDFVITKYVDRNDNTIMLKGGYPRFDDKDDFIKVKFTVKEHTEYKGEKQTIVQRIASIG
jgi:hypothetical protein